YQYQKQQQTVGDRLAQLQEIEDNARIELREQRQKIETRQAEIARLQEEQRRLQLEMSQGGQELVNTTATTQKDIQEALVRNEQRIADIDSQLVQAILNILVENEKRIKELNSRISQLQQRLKYQEVRAKVAGKVFDLQAYNGFVANPSEKLLEIVPQDQLLAEVFITNQDIGFVKEGMDADVRIDTFPFSEFGDIDGTVQSIGSDALPPDENNQYYRFPAKVELEQQALTPKGGRRIPLQSGMSVTVNIKVREDRKVISLFIELFTDQIESLKQVR
ncbi:MAG: HlyD family efflux transporter periplasmic adaptor subunit, partial [Kamptonema sp. SIO4C4]|nr:HlyD family efflux transporter periplasmic adaptor subunit [Kamptonema sp. SIO4C4]